MPNSRKCRIAVGASLLLTACSSAQPRPGVEQGELAALADRYFEEVFFKYSPTRGILGAKIPGFGHDGWRWFWSQQHGDNGLGGAPRIPQPPGRRLVAAAEGGLATTLERTPCRAPVMK